MKNRLISLLLTAIMIVTLIPGTAFAKTYGGEFNGRSTDPNGNPYIFTWIFDEASETLYVEGVGEMVAEYSATNQPWAAHKSKIKHLVIEEGITFVSKRGFASMPALKTIKFPTSLVSLGMRSFENCKALETITIPGTLKTIAAQSFLGCTSLKTVIIEDGVANMNEYMFGSCTALTDVYVYSKNLKISRAHSNQDDGVWFRGCNFDILTVHCYEGTDADKYFKEDIYTITNWSDGSGDRKQQNYAEKPNSMVSGGYRLKVEPIAE